jgi:hypothetical protein
VYSVPQSGGRSVVAEVIVSGMAVIPVTWLTECRWYSVGIGAVDQSPLAL